jgi:predicted Rossmann-fold nucleotide-binding protein
MRVSVIGGSRIDDDTYEEARAVGRLLGERGHAVVCGGLGGVMEAVCRGAREAGRSARSERPSGDSGAAGRTPDAETIGILPGTDREAANEWVTTPVAPGMGNARNALVVMNGDAVVAVDGGTGTLSELGHALDFDKPVAGIGTHRIDGVDGIEHVETPEAAVESVERRV